jgi:hypothetical protein
MMSHPSRFIHGVFQHLLGAWGKVQFCSTVLTWASQALYYFLNPIGLQAQFTQDAPGNSPFFAHQTKKEMLRTNVIMVHPLSFLMCQTEHSPCPLSETFHAARHRILRKNYR